LRRQGSLTKFGIVGRYTREKSEAGPARPPAPGQSHETSMRRCFGAVQQGSMLIDFRRLLFVQARRCGQIAKGLQGQGRHGIIGCGQQIYQFFHRIKDRFTGRIAQQGTQEAQQDCNHMRDFGWYRRYVVEGTGGVGHKLDLGIHRSAASFSFDRSNQQ